MSSERTEDRDGVRARIVEDEEGVALVECVACGAALVDDDRSPFYDADSDDGTPHVCRAADTEGTP